MIGQLLVELKSLIAKAEAGISSYYMDRHEVKYRGRAEDAAFGW